MNRLLDIGFQVVGHWHLVTDRLRIAIRLHSAQRNILYAFVCDGSEVKYVGKSTQTLQARMSGYMSPGTEKRTNLRVHELIREQIEKDVTVEVYALPDSGLMHYGPFHLNLAAGLEDSIIATLKPEWNSLAGKRGLFAHSASGEEIGEPDGASELVVTPATGGFDVVLQPTYWKKGFFNGGVASSAQLGADGDTIEIFFGDEAEPSLGTINRTANANGTPRIFGGPELRKKFQAHPEMTPMHVEVLSPTSIRIKPDFR